MAPRLIVHVIHHLVIGGMENGVVNLVNRLPRERFRHAIVCIEDSSDFAARIQWPDVQVHALHRSRIGIWRLRLGIFRLLRQLRPDIVHTRNLSGLDALLPARLAHAKTVHSEHGFDVDNLHGLAWRPKLVRRVHAPLVQRYVSVSQNLRGLMSEQWGLPPSRITQIYNGVDTDTFQPPSKRPRQLLPEGFRRDGLFIVGTVGRLRPVKDHDTLLCAFAGLARRRADLRARLRLMVVGDGPLRDELMQRARALGIAEQVWFAGARQDIAALMQVMDLFVLPSLNEGVSNTLLEAMAAGLPVLATAVGGNVELMDAGVVGADFAPGDRALLADLTERYADDADLCRRHGAAARERAVRHFSLRTMVQNYAKLYEAL